MKIILKRSKLTDVILTPQKGEADQNSRLCTYVQRVDTSDGILFYHLMTGEIVLTEHEDEDKEELYRKYFYVPEDHDDYKFYQSFNSLYAALEQQHSKTVNSFTILTTTDCNARCFYCYELGTRREAMSSETAGKAVEYIRKNADITKPIHLSWFGGEPLFNLPVIDQICTALKKENIEYSSSMISNGYLFDEGVVKQAVELWKLKKVQITLDGTEEIYNKRKAYIYHDGISAYEKVVKNIGLLANEEIDVNIRLNLDSKNQTDLLKLIGELASVFENKEHITVYCHELFQCSEEEGISDLKKAIDEKIRECGFYKKKYVQLGMKLNYCMADSPDSIIIMPDGTLQACEHFNVQESLGDIDHNNNKKAMLSYYRERIVEERCKTCPLLPQCIKLKHCPNVKIGCNDETIRNKQKAIRESVIHYYEKQVKTDE